MSKFQKVASKVGFVIDVAGRAQMDSTPDSMRNNLVGPDGAGGKKKGPPKKVGFKFDISGTGNLDQIPEAAGGGGGDSSSSSASSSATGARVPDKIDLDFQRKMTKDEDGKTGFEFSLAGKGRLDQVPEYLNERFGGAGKRFCRRRKPSKGQLAGRILFLLAVLALSIALVVVGADKKDDCPVEPMIPKFMIVFGVTVAVYALVKFGLFLTKYGRAYRERRKPGVGVVLVRGFAALLGLFNFVWFIVGSVYVFKEYKPDYEDELNPGYCAGSAYKFAAVVLVLLYTVLLVAALMACCTCCCVSCLCCFAAGSASNQVDDGECGGGEEDSEGGSEDGDTAVEVAGGKGAGTASTASAAGDDDDVATELDERELERLRRVKALEERLEGDLLQVEAGQPAAEGKAAETAIMAELREEEGEGVEGKDRP